MILLITSNLKLFYIKRSYFESKNNVISINLICCNNHCLYSLKRFSLAINYLFSPFFMLFILLILTLENLNTVIGCMDLSAHQCLNHYNLSKSL